MTQRPPKGYTPVPRSRAGGHRRRVGGKWRYWYPDTSGPVRAARKRLRELQVSESTATYGEETPSYVYGQSSPTGRGARVLSLFTGIGGLDLGISRALPEAEHVGMVEQNDFARDVLASQFPGVPLHEDVIDVAADPSVVTRPNIVLGGFPCTDVSAAKQGACGLEGASSGLYRRMADIVRATDPDWVVYENTPHLRSRGLEELLADHREMGYELAWDGVPAESVGAPHERDRIFLVAHRPGVDFEFTPPERSDHWSEPGAVPVLPAEDPRANPAHKEQLRAAGNAVLPQVGEHIGQLIQASKPGERDLSGARPIAVWNGTAWVEPQRGLFGEAEPVTSWPRAGVMRGDTVYEVPTAAPKRHASTAPPVGQTVWVRNPDPRVEHPTTAELAGLTDAELQTLQTIRREGEPSYTHEPYLSRLDPETAEERATMDRLVARDLLRPDYSLTRVGEGLGGVEATWRRDRGGVGHENAGVVLEVNDSTGVAAVEMNAGVTSVVPTGWLSRYPTPTTSEWRGGAPGDKHEWRERGGQLRHWVTRQVSPEFSSHMMGLPPGWLDVQKSFDDIRSRSWLLQKAEGRAAKGASEAAEAAEPKTQDGSKPPKGFVALKNSKKGGYRKRMGNGGYVYWYPGKDGGKGRVTTKKHKSDIGTKDVLLSILESVLPPDKRSMIVKLRDLLEGGGDIPGATPDADAPEGEAGDAPGGETAEPDIPDELTDLHADYKDTQDKLRTEAMRHELERRRAEMQVALEELQELMPGMSDERADKVRSAIHARFGVPEGKPENPKPGDTWRTDAGYWAVSPDGKQVGPVKSGRHADRWASGEAEERLARAFADLVGDILWKARSTKYCRREPTGNPKRPWRYYYGDDCGTAAARGLKTGDIVAMGAHKVEVVEAKDGTITFKAVDGDKFFGRDPAVFESHEVSAMFAKHFGASYQRSADRRARQAVNAVLRHVPANLLAELEGTDAERLEQLKLRAPDIHKRLSRAFTQAGVDLSQARRVIVDTLGAQGWDTEARAALIGNLLNKRGAWLAHNYRRAISAAGNLRTSGETVSATHVQAAIDIIKPGGPADNVDKLTAAVEDDVKKLQKALSALRGWQATNPTLGVGSAIEVLTELVDNPHIAQLMTVARALPGAQNETTDAVREMVESLQAEIPRPPSRLGAETQVFVAGPNGQPVGLPGRYKLVEAGEAIPSHKPDTFAPHPDYPEGLQERAYHRDKSEQMKVTRNAQRMKPGFLINTNPDALNGPPIMTEDGVVLGGNSRTMSMQRAYAMHPDKAAEYREYLEANMHQAGFSAADLEGMEQPILMRVVETEGHDVNLLVRQMNESFIQAMDPRTMQVAMGRRLTSENLTELADTMDPDETLRAYLDTPRARGFISTLSRAGVIDDRNRSQYMRMKGGRDTGKLNEDGKQLVERILVGHLIPDPDLLSNTNATMLGSIARVVPYLVQAEGSSSKYNIRQALRDALEGHIRMHDMGFQPKRGATEAERAESVRATRNQMTDLFRGDHPVLADERTGMLFDVMVKHGGPVRLAKVFREYAVQAAGNPEGQQTLIGKAPEPQDILRNAIASLDNKEAREEAREARIQAAVKERGGGGLFRSFAEAKARLEEIR
jgi:hypothetical protein